MGVVMILLIWVIAPFGELGIIIGLLVSNSRYKRRIQEMEQAGSRRAAAGGSIPESREWNSAPGYEPPGAAERRRVTELRENETCQRGSVQEERRVTELRENETCQRGSVQEERRVTGLRENETCQRGSGQEGQRITELRESGTWQRGKGQEAQENRSAEEADRGDGGGMQKKVRDGISGSLGVIALTLGVIFIVLAGLIFATTTWHILPDLCKTFLVLACAVLFFGVSLLAEKLFRIHKTSSAFYILGCAFLFLSVLAAAYFKLLGPGFILDQENRWKVLWVGSLALEISFFAGIKRFHDKIYTQISLWGISVSLFFLAKAFAVTWNGFVSMMMIYAVLLIIIRKFLEEGEPGEKEGFRELLAGGFRTFAPVQFWFFGGIVVIRGFFAENRMLAEILTGDRCEFLDRFSLFCFTLPGMAAMTAVLAGLWLLAEQGQRKIHFWLLRVVTVETAIYTAGMVSDQTAGRMLTVNLIFLGLYVLRRGKKDTEEEGVSLFWDIWGCLALMATITGFCSDINGNLWELIFCLAAFGGYYIWFYRSGRQWPHLLASIGILPLPFIAGYQLELNFDQLAFGVGAILLLSGAAARYFYPIMKEDHRVEGGWRMDWFQILSIFVILAMAVKGDDRWRFVYILLAALHFQQYRAVGFLKKPALFVSACFLAAAFRQQPFIIWPAVLQLEMELLPAVWLIWTAGAVWDRNPWVRVMQTLGYLICLFLLCQDAFLSGQVADALILEGICLAVFVWAQLKGNVLWVRISGALILLVVIFMTRDFWLSISWWVYLLAAGVGLMVFAAVMEKNRRI